MNKKVWTKEEIREKLATSDAWLQRGILALSARQTETEQAAEVTIVRNDKGFNQPDSYFLSSLARQLRSYRRPAHQNDITLTPRQLQVARRKMLKYAGQLARIANNEL